MVIQAKFDKATSVVGRYRIDAGDRVVFTVILKENAEGFREFEIELSANGSDDLSEVFEHPFYNNYVLPWSYHNASTAPPMYSNNVVNISDFKAKK